MLGRWTMKLLHRSALHPLSARGGDTLARLGCPAMRDSISSHSASLVSRLRINGAKFFRRYIPCLLTVTFSASVNVPVY